jgi:hypothetical protein
VSTDHAAVIISAIVGFPVLAFAHELGHAGAALRFTRGPVRIRVGRADLAVKLRVGRLFIEFSPFGVDGECRSSRVSSRREALIRTLAGPAVNGVLAVLLSLAALATSGVASAVLFTLTAANGVGLLNLIPFRTTWNPNMIGRPSDGLKAMCLIRNRPLPPPPPRRKPTGLWDPVERRTVIVALLVSLPLGLLLITLNYEPAWWILAVYSMQETITLFSPRSTRSPASATASPNPPAVEPTANKTCPKCAASVPAATRLCFCFHRFGRSWIRLD